MAKTTEEKKAARAVIQARNLQLEIKEMRASLRRANTRKYEVQEQNLNLHKEVTQLRIEHEAHLRAIQAAKEVPFLRQMVQKLVLTNADLASVLNSKVEIIQVSKERNTDGLTTSNKNA